MNSNQCPNVDMYLQYQLLIPLMLNQGLKLARSPAPVTLTLALSTYSIGPEKFIYFIGSLDSIWPALFARHTLFPLSVTRTSFTFFSRA